MRSLKKIIIIIIIIIVDVVVIIIIIILTLDISAANCFVIIRQSETSCFVQVWAFSPPSLMFPADPLCSYWRSSLFEMWLQYMKRYSTPLKMFYWLWSEKKTFAMRLCGWGYATVENFTVFVNAPPLMTTNCNRIVSGVKKAAIYVAEITIKNAAEETRKCLWCMWKCNNNSYCILRWYVAKTWLVFFK